MPTTPTQPEVMGAASAKETFRRPAHHFPGWLTGGEELPPYMNQSQFKVEQDSSMELGE